MIESSNEYKKAIIGDARRILLKAVIDIVDPDLVYGEVTASSESVYSNSAQIHDKKFINPIKNATLEHNRWALDGTFGIYSDNPDENENYKFMTDSICGSDGVFDVPQYVELNFSNVSILQAFSVYFPDNKYDGIPESLVVEILQGGVPQYAQTISGNEKAKLSFDGFTVYNPDCIRVTVYKMSLPFRRFRVVEIVPGIYEDWGGDMFASFSVKHQGDISCVSLPYGTCSIKIDNANRKFEPRTKNGLFQSIEDRQGIDVSVAVRLEDGTDEYKRLGVFYQHSGGWKTGDNGLTIQWDLVDIIGLLASREFVVPATLPTTLDGWVSAIVSQLGVNFADRYIVDADYSGLNVTVNSSDDIKGKSCGDILRWVCMATGTFPRADAETGKLACEPIWNNGNKIALDNLVQYPIIKANQDVAAIIFTVYNGEKTKYIVSGNSTASSQTLSVDNPFIKTQSDALTAAKRILCAYGGNRYEIVGRGDMTSEIGDVDTIWLNESTATTARRIEQHFDLSDGVLANAKSTLLQADGSFLFENRVAFTESGTWTAPNGVTSLRVILVGRGSDGATGENGTWEKAGKNGANGSGGKVWSSTININNGQSFNVEIGENAVFGSYSSANGRVYEYGYTDIASGESFARTGVKNPQAGSGDGGSGGVGGAKGNKHNEKIKETVEVENPETGEMEETTITSEIEVIDNYPGVGTKGASGQLGCVVVYWDKEAT